jgi:hydrogenase expression/formation protein HypD
VKMKFLDEFRSPAAARALAARLADAAQAAGRPLTFMEVCGTHTMAVFRHGLRSLLPPSIKLISGPGCPVCVTPVQFIDRAIALSRRSDVVVATFGDLLRVPGSTSTLERERSAGADVRVVYSPLEALEAAAASPSETVVFLGVGFETTAPSVASCVLKAEAEGIANYKILHAMKTMPRAMRAIVGGGGPALDGFLCPAHVSAIIGLGAYEFLAGEYGLPCVVAGFEPLDILMGLELIASQAASLAPAVLNQYTRVVRPEGNRMALDIMYKVLEPRDSIWRGLGAIELSGLGLREEYVHRDASSMDCDVEDPVEPPGCICGDVLRGAAEPGECPLFGTRCVPESPVGACMVSGEGTCAAHYKYGAGAASGANT